MEIIQSGESTAELSMLERAATCAEGLETVPAVARRLLALASDPDAAFADIVKVIASDATLTARVLRLAASALYGGRAPSTLNAAVVRLGLNEVRNLALSASLSAKSPDAFHRSLSEYSLRSAVLAEALAKRLGRGRFCEPFVCALLQELGTLVLAKLEGAPYHAVVGTIGSREQVERERKVFGFTHCDIGAFAVQRWNLFAGIEQVIQFHHDPLHAEFLAFPAPVLATVQLVALTSALLESGEEALSSEAGGALVARLGTSAEVVREELARAQPLMAQYLAGLN